MLVGIRMRRIEFFGDYDRIVSAALFRCIAFWVKRLLTEN